MSPKHRLPSCAMVDVGGLHRHSRVSHKITVQNGGAAILSRHLFQLASTKCQMGEILPNGIRIDFHIFLILTMCCLHISSYFTSYISICDERFNTIDWPLFGYFAKSCQVSSLLTCFALIIKHLSNCNNLICTYHHKQSFMGL